MEVTITDIIDRSQANNSERAKILLMDSLINHFTPLFYEDLRKKQGQIKSNQADITKLKKIINNSSNKLVEIQKRIDIETLKNQILKEVDYLNDIDVLYGKNKILVQTAIISLDKQTIGDLKKSLVVLQTVTKEKLIKRRKG